MSFRVVVLAPLGLSLACAQTSGLEFGPEFPEAATLEHIAASPVQQHDNASAGLRQSRWELEQPLPNKVGVGPALGDTPGEQLLTALVEADPNFQIDEQLTCAAHQLARFVAVHGSPPTEVLRQYMAHRCGVTTPKHDWRLATFDASPVLADAQQLLADAGFTGRTGLWLAPRGHQWILVAAVGEPTAKIEPLPMATTGDEVIVYGRAHGKSKWIQGYVTHGKHDVGVCRDQTDVGDTFRLVCPVLRTDAGAYIDLYASDPERTRVELEARIWISPDRSLAATFVDPAWEQPHEKLSGSLGAEFVAAINEIRIDAGSEPLQVSLAQSEVSKAVRPHYRHAKTIDDAARLLDITGGLLAGWAIEGPILGANFGELEFESVGGREHLLDALAQPSLRAMLLDPRARSIAIAVDLGKPSEVREGMFTTYYNAEPDVGALDSTWLYDSFDLARVARNLPKLGPLRGGPEELSDAAAGIVSGVRGVEEGFAEALADISARNVGRTIRGGAFLTNDIRNIVVPDEIMVEGNVELATHVVLMESPTRPWAWLLVMYVYGHSPR
jgi:hypothetical protein